MRLIFSTLLVFLITLVHAQTATPLTGKSLGALKQMNQKESKPKLFSTPLLIFPTSTNAPITNKSTIATIPIPLAYAYKDLALFCKLEVKMEKVVKIPVKFRLGSVDYVDWLEGKRENY